MKKVLFLILVIFLLVGCGKKDSTDIGGAMDVLNKHLTAYVTYDYESYCDSILPEAIDIEFGSIELCNEDMMDFFQGNNIEAEYVIDDYALLNQEEYDVLVNVLVDKYGIEESKIKDIYDFNFRLIYPDEESKFNIYVGYINDNWYVITY